MEFDHGSYGIYLGLEVVPMSVLSDYIWTLYDTD